MDTCRDAATAGARSQAGYTPKTFRQPGKTVMAPKSQLPEAELRRRVRQRIDNNQLLGVAREEVAAGYGRGHMCVVCDQPITPTQVEYEVADDRDNSRLSFHLNCHAVWQQECAQAKPQGSGHRPLGSERTLRPARRLQRDIDLVTSE